MPKFPELSMMFGLAYNRNSEFCVFATAVFIILLPFLATMASWSNVGVAQQDGGQSTEARVKAAVVTKNRVIERTHLFSSFFYTGIPVVDLGSVEAGSTVELALRVENKTETDFKLKRVIVSCNCLNVRSSGNEIKSNDSFLVTAILKVPSTSRNAKQSQALNLEGIDGKTVQMEIRYEIAGLCSFATQAVNINVERSASKIAIKLPLIVTEPVKWMDIKVHGTDDYSNLKASVAKTSDEFFLVGEITVPERDGFTLAGTFCIEDSSGGVRDSLQCFIGREPKVTVSPSRIRFFRNKDQMHASVVIRVNKDYLPDGTATNLPPISVGAAINKSQLTVEVSQLSRGIARAKMSFKESDLIKVVDGRISLPSSLSLQIAWDNGIFESEHSIAFD